jgi:hypothetical protein
MNFGFSDLNLKWVMISEQNRLFIKILETLKKPSIQRNQNLRLSLKKLNLKKKELAQLTYFEINLDFD